MKHLNSHEILLGYLRGFRQIINSCESQLLLTVDDFTKGLNDRKQTNAVSVDFQRHSIR